MSTNNLTSTYLQILDHTLYSLDAGVQYAFLNSFIRSVLQAAAISAIDYCHHTLESTELAGLTDLAHAMLSPSDGIPIRVLDKTIAVIRQTSNAACCSKWYAPTQGYPDNQCHSLYRRLEDWVSYRNNRPGHGVVAEDVVREGLSWLPILARDVVNSLSDLLPIIGPDGSLQLEIVQGDTSYRLPIIALKLHERTKPIVVRSIQMRGQSWRVAYQALDGNESEDGAYEIPPNAPIIALTQLDQQLYRSKIVSSDDGQVWRPTILLPNRQTAAFVGRTHELRELAEWMDNEDSRMCNVFGEGGIGKTTMVLEYLNSVINGEVPPPGWQPLVICFYSAKETRWGPDGLQQLRGAVPSVEDAAREIAKCYQDRLDRSWFEGDAKRVIDRTVTLLKELDLTRNDVLLVLDNTETLARSADDEIELGKTVTYLARKLCRVIVTSRRREKLEANPIQISPMSEEEGASLLKRLGSEYNAQPFLQCGPAKLKQVARKLSGRPLLLDVCSRLVGKFGYTIDKGVENTIRQADGDLGSFLYEDAWIRIGEDERLAFLVIGRLGSTINGEVVGWTCAELRVSHAQVLSAFEETRFGALLDFGTHYDLTLDPSTRAFLAHRFGQANSETKATVERVASKVQSKYRRFIDARESQVQDRVAQAFRTSPAKAAYLAAKRGDEQEAVRWYEEAIEHDRGNAALLDRFAWYLMKIKDIKRALQISKAACEIDSTDADAHFTLAMIFARIPDISKADEYFSIAERLGKPSHLCKLQMAQARSRTLKDLLNRDKVDLSFARILIEEANLLIVESKLGHAVKGNLDSKHEAERQRIERILALQEHSLGLRLAAAANKRRAR